MSIDIFSNQTFCELTDCLFWFIQIKITIEKGIKPKGIKLLWPTNWFWYKTIHKSES